MVLSIYTLFLSMSTKIFSRFFSLPPKCTSCTIKAKYFVCFVEKIIYALTLKRQISIMQALKR